MRIRTSPQTLPAAVPRGALALRSGLPNSNAARVVQGSSEYLHDARTHDGRAHDGRVQRMSPLGFEKGRMLALYGANGGMFSAPPSALLDLRV